MRMVTINTFSDTSAHCFYSLNAYFAFYFYSFVPLCDVFLFTSNEKNRHYYPLISFNTKVGLAVVFVFLTLLFTVKKQFIRNL